MKKATILILAILTLAAFALSSCGASAPGSDTPLTRPENAGGTAPLPSGAGIPDFSSIMAGNGKTDTVWGLQDPAARQEIIDAAKADGFDVSFGADGSMTVKDKDGTYYIVEISYGYSVRAYYNCQGYWDRKLRWHSDKVTPEQWIINDLLTK